MLSDRTLGRTVAPASQQIRFGGDLPSVDSRLGETSYAKKFNDKPEGGVASATQTKKRSPQTQQQPIPQKFAARPSGDPSPKTSINRFHEFAVSMLTHGQSELTLLELVSH